MVTHSYRETKGPLQFSGGRATGQSRGVRSCRGRGAHRLESRARVPGPSAPTSVPPSLAEDQCGGVASRGGFEASSGLGLPVLFSAVEETIDAIGQWIPVLGFCFRWRLFTTSRFQLTELCVRMYTCKSAPRGCLTQADSEVLGDLSGTRDEGRATGTRGSGVYEGNRSWSQLRTYAR